PTDRIADAVYLVKFIELKAWLGTFLPTPKRSALTKSVKLTKSVRIIREGSTFPRASGRKKGRPTHRDKGMGRKESLVLVLFPSRPLTRGRSTRRLKKQKTTSAAPPANLEKPRSWRGA